MLASLFNIWSETDILKALAILDRLGIADQAAKRAEALSGGQQPRVAIARALMQDPAMILADEPTSSLDPKTSVEVMELFVEIAERRGIPVIINIHNVALAKRYAQRIIGMSRGAVVFDGPPADLKESHLMDIYSGEGFVE